MTPERNRWPTAVLVAGTFLGLLWLERRRPLRRAVEPKLRRQARNLAMAGLSELALRVAETPVTTRLTCAVEKRRWGLLQRVSLPRWLEVALAAVMLDYTLYLWHVLTHKVPWLWRFHQVHHVDLDMDASTGIRFHPGEMVASVAWRAGQILIIGVSAQALAIWNTALLMEVMFHHCNVQLPPSVERRLCRFIVTPRMHGIHHSIVREEANSNWSGGLSIWDRLHGTLRLDVPQERVVIGLPAYRTPEEVTLPRLLRMPFAPQRPPFALPDGVAPRPPALSPIPPA